MICSIIQPTFFPWSGYFNIIYNSDLVIFLDDAQYSKNSWHNRNQIVINKKKSWITIPLKKSKLKTKIFHKEIDNTKNWKEKMIKTINQNYSKCNYYKDLDEILKIFLNNNQKNLAMFNINLIKFISDKLKIKKKFILASSLNIQKDRTKKIISILELVRAKKYLSPIGAKDYLEEDKFEKKTKVELLFNNFNCKPYPQKDINNFIDYLSIIDLVANVGWTNASTYVKK